LVLLAGPAARAQFTYTTANGTVTITGYTGSGGALAIPNTLGGLPVIGIAGQAFYEISTLTSVTIPSSVTNIGPGPFEDCVLLSSISVAPGNPAYTSVGGVLFNKDLTTLVQYPPHKSGTSYAIPNIVTNIADDAFAESDYLTSITIPNGVNNIGNGGFFFTALSSITIPATVTNIGQWAFEDCARLDSINFEGNAPTVGSYSFETHSQGNTTAYYYAGTTGWDGYIATAFAVGGVDAVMLTPETGSLDVTISPPAAVSAGAQWTVDDGILNDSGATVTNLLVGSHTVSFTSVSGWITPANQTVTIKNAVTTKATAVYTKPPSGNPKLTITTPKSGQTMSNPIILVTGAVTDTVPMEAVYYQLDGGAWTPATAVNSWTNWTATVTLNPGSNTISAYAQDVSGATSPTNRLSLIYAVKAPIHVMIRPTGWGTVRPNYDGQSLQIGNSFSMMAQAAAGMKFVNWTRNGQFYTNIPRASFVMASNLTFVASFADITPPLCVITYPAVGHSVSNSPVTAAVKTSDKYVSVAGVFYRLNGGPWKSDASSTDGTNWSIVNLALTPGANTLQAYAQDSAGNVSRTNTVAFKYVAPPTNAPASLSDYEAMIKPTGSNQTLLMSWGDETWAQAGTGTDTNANDYCAGTYTYVRTGPDTASLTNTDIGMMAALGSTNVTTVSLTFTGPATATLAWTNETSSGSGTMTIARASHLVPTSLAGKTLRLNSSSGGPTITLNADGTFTQTQQGRTHSGNYTFTQSSPTVGILEQDFTDATEDGARAYVEMVFTSAAGGTGYGCYYQNPNYGSNPDDAGVGIFTIQ
jgi:hypothetical protein